MNKEMWKGIVVLVVTAIVGACVLPPVVKKVKGWAGYKELTKPLQKKVKAINNVHRLEEVKIEAAEVELQLNKELLKNAVSQRVLNEEMFEVYHRENVCAQNALHASSEEEPEKVVISKK